MGFEFEGRWRAEVERRAQRSAIAPREAEQFNTPEAVQDHIEYIHGFEAKHAVLWKWLLIWILYPVIVVPLMAMDLLTVIRQRDPYPQALIGFLVGGFIFSAAYFGLVYALWILTQALTYKDYGHYFMASRPLLWVHIWFSSLFFFICVMRMLSSNMRTTKRSPKHWPVLRPICWAICSAQCL